MRSDWNDLDWVLGASWRVVRAGCATPPHLPPTQTRNNSLETSRPLQVCVAVQFINRIKNWHFLNPSWRLSVSKRNQHWVADWLSPRWRHPPSSSPTGRRGGKAGSFSLSRIQTNYLIYSGEKNEDERVLKIFPDWAKTEMYLCLNNY